MISKTSNLDTERSRMQPLQRAETGNRSVMESFRRVPPARLQGPFAYFLNAEFYVETWIAAVRSYESRIRISVVK